MRQVGNYIQQFHIGAAFPWIEVGTFRYHFSSRCGFFFYILKPRFDLQRSTVLNDCIKMDQKARDYSLKRDGIHNHFWCFENSDLCFSAVWKLDRNRDLEIQCRVAVWCKPQVSSTEGITHGILFGVFLHVYICNQGPRFRFLQNNVLQLIQLSSEFIKHCRHVKFNGVGSTSLA